MNSISWKENKQKFQNFVQTLYGNMKEKNTSKRFSKLLRDIICQIEQFLNYMLMTKSQNILVALMMFLSQLKLLMKNYMQRRPFPKLLLLIFLTKFLRGRKFLFNNFTFTRLNVLFAEITKSVDKF